MGCDIHIVVEVKEKGWSHFYPQGRFKASRWYTMFSYLNRNVRNYDEVDGFEERGFPEGTFYQEGTEETYNDLGDHSYSWLTSFEFEEARNKAYSTESVTNVEDYNAILQYMQYYERKGHQTRVLFGFDS